MKNGRNDMINLITSDGTMSANKTAPVEILLQTLPESGWASALSLLC